MRAWVLAAAAAMGLATQAGAVTVSYNSGPLDLVSACYAEWREFDCLAEGGSVPTRMYWTADFDIADEDLEFEEGVASVEFGPDYVSESNVRSYLWDGSAWVEDDFVWGSILIFLTMKLSETGTASDWNIMMEHSVYDWIWYLDVIDGAPAVTGWFARETETDLPVRAIYATAPAPVPLPAGGVLLLSGLMAAGLLRKRVSR